MSTESNPNLKTNDPALAVVIEKLINLEKTLQENREEQSQQSKDFRESVDKKITEIENEIKEVKGFMSDIKTKFNIAKGGYMVMIGITGILAWMLGTFEKLYKLFS